MSVSRPSPALLGEEVGDRRAGPGRLRPPRPRGGRSWRARDAVPHDASARTGIFTASTSWSSAGGVSPAGAHQHEAQAHAVTNGAWSATASGSVRGLRLIANAA